MQQHLFHGVNIFDVLEGQKMRLKSAVQHFSPEQLKQDDQTLINNVTEDYSIAIPKIREEEIYVTKREIEIDYTHDRNMAFRFGTFGEHLVLPGVEVTLHIPFDGDGAFFGVQPQTFSLNPPRGEVVGDEVQIKFEVLPEDATLKNQTERVVAQMKEHLEWLKPSAQQLAAELRDLARAQVVKRRQQQEAQANIVNSLGYPVRERKGEAAVSARSKGSRSESKSEWDVFVSHATEDQDDFARPLAEILQKRGLKVWFSEFSLTVGDSLRKSIDKGLASSRFGVVILSKHFFEKHWPQQELNGMATREVSGTKVILPVWHNVTFEDVREFSPTLADRYGVKTDRGVEFVVDQLFKAINA